MERNRKSTLARIAAAIPSCADAAPASVNVTSKKEVESKDGGSDHGRFHYSDRHGQGCEVA